MARTNTIDTHPDREKIIAEMASGVPFVDIARRYPPVSVYALSRYKTKRSDMLGEILKSDSVDVTDVFGRVVDLADSARIARRLADAMNATPSVRAKAISTELTVLDRLMNRLGMDDTSLARHAQAVTPLVRAIQRVARKHPQDVLDALAEYSELEELRHELKAALQREKRNER